MEDFNLCYPEPWLQPHPTPLGLIEILTADQCWTPPKALVAELEQILAAKSL